VTGLAASLSDFEQGWVASQPVTPQIAYQRTLRLLRWYLETVGRDVEKLTADDLEAFVAWHAANGLADDLEGSRKVAIHTARIGAHLAGQLDRPDLAIDRDRLRAIPF
jgi:hypothetical protein